MAQSQADKLRAEEGSLRALERQKGPTVRAARKVFIHQSHSPPPPITSTKSRPATVGLFDVGGSPQRVQEAVREAARDCIRREEIMRRHRVAVRAETEARRVSEMLENKKREERLKLAYKTKQEGEWLALQMEREATRRLNASSSMAVREEEKKQIAEIRAKHDDRLRNEKERRAKLREVEDQERVEAESAMEEEEEEDGLGDGAHGALPLPRVFNHSPVPLARFGLADRTRACTCTCQQTPATHAGRRRCSSSSAAADGSLARAPAAARRPGRRLVAWSASRSSTPLRRAHNRSIRVTEPSAYSQISSSPSR